MEESLELGPRQESLVSLTLVPMEYVLVQAEADPIADEKDRKRVTVGANSSGSDKMIFTLLTEVVALHIRLTIVEVQKPGF